ncbi:MAG: efflux RND transporter periplasmic adaptor subunit, partial [Nitratireductor sp.]
EKDTQLFKVRYVSVNSQVRQDFVTIRGRTKADAIITLRAETSGILEKRLVNKGDKVEVGQIVCVLNEGSRVASLNEATARLKQTTNTYQSNLKLKEKGFTSNNRLTELKTAVDAAQAGLAAAKLELERINIKANANGIVQDPLAQVGDTLSNGSACATLIDTDPMLFTGQVPELLIGDLFIGMKADVKLVTGKEVTGKVTYIASAADADTRTYQVEIELDDSTDVREGMTAQTKVKLKGEKAFLISPSWISLSDEGVIGVRLIDAQNVVSFQPIEIISQGKDGFWIKGLFDGAQIISLGQEYVNAGESVIPSLDERDSVSQIVKFNAANNTN